MDGADEASFTIIDGVLRFTTPPDFEIQATYAVTVIATDNGDPAMSGTKAVSVTITDVNDPPRFTSSDSFSMGENQTLLGTVPPQTTIAPIAPSPTSSAAPTPTSSSAPTTVLSAS